MLTLCSFFERDIERFYLTYENKKIARILFRREDIADQTSIEILGYAPYENVFCGYTVYNLGKDINKVKALIFNNNFIESWNRQCLKELHIKIDNSDDIRFLIDKLEL